MDGSVKGGKEANCEFRDPELEEHCYLETSFYVRLCQSKRCRMHSEDGGSHTGQYQYIIFLGPIQ